MGSKTKSKTTNTLYVRYAPYIESYHENFLTETFAQGDVMISPYANCATLDANDAFFSTGYALSNFPSLYDMFGKFMAGLDIEVIWNNAFKDALSKTEINEAVAKEMALVDDKVTNDLVSFQLNMRNLNAIASSSFIVGKAIIEDARLKILAKLSLDSKLELIADVQVKFIASLNWMKKAITSYAELMKAYYRVKPDVDDYNTFNVSQNMLWPFTVLDFERAALGALQSTASFEKAVKRTRSTLSKVLLVASYTVTGAQLGSYFGPYGTAIGAVVGFVVGIAMLYLE